PRRQPYDAGSDRGGQDDPEAVPPPAEGPQQHAEEQAGGGHRQGQPLGLGQDVGIEETHGSSPLTGDGRRTIPGRKGLVKGTIDYLFGSHQWRRRLARRAPSSGFRAERSFFSCGSAARSYSSGRPPSASGTINFQSPARSQRCVRLTVGSS